jgi:hypothetical protein
VNLHILRRLLLVTTLVTSFNLIISSYYFFTDGPDFSNFWFWSLITQTFLVFFLFRLWSGNQELLLRARYVALTSILWMLAFFLNLLYWVAYLEEVGDYWTLSYLFSLASSAPKFPDGAPFGGLFHSVSEDSPGKVIWTFDWGVNLSWFTLHFLSVALVLSMLIHFFQARSCRRGNAMKEEAQFQESRDRIKSPQEDLDDPTVSIKCLACSSSIAEGHMFCSNCGEPVIPRHAAIVENEELECDQCGADLEKNQKFCGACGIAIDWSTNEISKVEDLTFSEKVKSIFIGKDEIIGGAALIAGVLFLIFMFWPNEPNRQEECFDREMLKFGAYADPKGWAIKSRLYCQSLYP